MQAQSGDYRAAMQSFREALQYGGPEWVHYERVTRDLSALETNAKDQP